MPTEPTSTLVERRLRFIERRQALQRDAASLDARTRTPMGTGPANRHGMPTVPTGQRVVSNWPVLDLGENLSLARAVEDDVLLVHTWEGAPLPAEHGGPCRMITPKLYAWKGTKWIRRIEFLAEDRPGFWEVRGYSSTAEPWLDDRYAD